MARFFDVNRDAEALAIHRAALAKCYRSGREREAGGRHIDCERSRRQPGDYVVQ